MTQNLRKDCLENKSGTASIFQLKLTAFLFYTLNSGKEISKYVFCNIISWNNTDKCVMKLI